MNTIKTNKKKLLCLFIALLMMFTMIPVTAETFAETTPAAAIGTKTYDTLQAAINNAAQGDTIELLRDISDERQSGLEDCAIIIPSHSIVTIDLNGKNITESSYSATVKAQGTLTLKGEGTISNTAANGKAFSATFPTLIKLAEGFGFDFVGEKVTDSATVNVLEEFTVTKTFDDTLGTIEGPSTVLHGKDATYKVTPKTGYKTTSIKVDGIAQKITSSTGSTEVTLPKVSKDQTITAGFAIRTFKITASKSTSPSVFTGGSITSSATVNYGANKTYKITPATGFKISKVLVDGVSIGAKSSYTFSNVTKAHTIKAYFKKSSLFIMLDAGHIGLYNRYPGTYGGKYYYESQMAWKLHKYLKSYLLTYKTVVVGTTRSSMYTDMDVYTRGTKAKGYDLFLSLHSNSSTSSSADYPLVIRQLSANSSEKSLASKLSSTIGSTMKTKQSPQVWATSYTYKGKKYDWYGVLRGSNAVGCNGYILEHSFHSNYKKAKWLYSSTNLKKMAKAEAATIAKHYGLAKKTISTVKVTPYRVKVANSTASIRSNAGSMYDKVGTAKKGYVYTIVKKTTDGKWGKMTCKNGGWIYLSYTKKTTSTTNIKTYKVKNTVSKLYIRKGPGTNYTAVGSIKNKTKYYKILKESSNGLWGKIGAGKWICLSYVKRYY